MKTSPNTSALAPLWRLLQSALEGDLQTLFQQHASGHGIVTSAQFRRPLQSWYWGISRARPAARCGRSCNSAIEGISRLSQQRASGHDTDIGARSLSRPRIRARSVRPCRPTARARKRRPEPVRWRCSAPGTTKVNVKF